MADISTRMSVSGLSEYKNAMNQAAQSVKTLDAQLKKADAEFKATGDKEKYMADKAKILEDRLKAQKTAAKNAQEAMKLLQKNGDTTSTTYQKLAQQLAQAETGILETSASLNQLGQSEQEAAKGADQLTASVNGIGKKISLQQVIGGINKITDGLEAAAKKAVELGKAIWTEITEQAQKADDIATKATMYDMTPEQYQAIAKVAATWGDTSVEAIMKARQRVQGKISDIADDLLGIGVDPYKNKKRILGTDQYVGEWKDWQDIFWEAGDALLNLSDQYEKSEKAQAIFGRKWEELMPMFKMGRELYEKTVASQIVADNESIAKLEELNNTIIKLQGDFESLEQEFLAGMAPALTEASKVLDDLLEKLMEYLKTPAGQEMLQKLGDAVSGLFEDLANIDPESVVNNFVSVFDKLVGSFEWITQHWSDVEKGLKAIVGVWAGGKAVSGALTIIELLNGLKGLTGGGTGIGKGALTGNGTLTASLTGIITTALKAALPVLGTITVATLAITASTVLLGASLNSSETMKEAAERGKKENAELDRFNREVAAKSTNEPLKEAHTALANWNTPQYGTTAIGELPDMQEFARRYIAFMRDFADDATMDAVSDIVFEKGEEFAEDFLSAMEAVLLNENDYTGKSQQRIVDMVDEIMYAVRERMAEEVVFIKVQPIIEAGSTMSTLATSGVAGLVSRFAGGRANGLPFVPFDGYPAVLHKGEQVVPAREVSNRSYNSNLYVENMNMSNGMDAQALATALSAQSRRISAGYGS